MNTQVKKHFTKTCIASMVTLSLLACQSTEQEDNSSVENDKVKQNQQVKVEQAKRDQLAQERKYRQLLESRQEAEQVAVTGSRMKSVAGDMAYAPPQRMIMPSVPQQAVPLQELNRENYKDFEDSGVFSTHENPVSTFSIDVDTASYTNVRRMLNDGYLPPEDAVRLEEFINYFDYDFAAPDNSEQPFAVSMETMNAPWNKDAHLVQIGIKGFEPEQQSLPPSNLVFLVDVSGSMQSPDKLGLVKKSLKMLARQSSPQDMISLVVYAGASGVVLEPTSAKELIKIEQALDKLTAGGSTNGGAGIELAYQMAQQAFIKDGINRVILATDGDFNVGLTNHDQLIDLIEKKRESGIYFSGLGFGSGNYNEHLMEELTNKGNGNYGYIDNLLEAKKLLVDQRAGTLMTIAKDVKIQVEFNPQVISEYRLLGYENRALRREDFNNDKIDAGEIGAGHSITALYEVVLNDSPGKRLDPLRYAQTSKNHEEVSDLVSEAAMVKLRYKLPEEKNSRLFEQALAKSSFNPKKTVSENLRFAASAAGFAQLLRDGQYLQDWNWQQAIDLAQQSKGNDAHGYRAEMIKLMQMAQLLDGSKLDKSESIGQVGLLEK